MTAPHARLERSALIGAVAWSLAMALLDLETTPALVLLGPLVAVPLALSLLAPTTAAAADARRWHLLGFAQLPAALLVLVSFTIDASISTAALALPWLAVCVIVAAAGFTRLLERGQLFVSETAADVGMIYLAVGGVWLVASRAGLPFMGFVEPIVLLTAAHFHFAGLVLPIVTAMAGRAVGGVHAGCAAFGVVLGMPLVAVGITLGAKGIAYFELGAAWWMSAACVLVAILGLRVAWRSRHVPETLLLAASSLALVAGMALAAVYALGAQLRAPWLDIPTMVRYHAAIQVFGFALPALVFWRFARLQRVADPPDPGLRILWRFLGERATLPPFTALDFRSESVAGPLAHDRRDSHELAIAVEARGAPERDGPFLRAGALLHHYDIFPPELLAAETSKTHLGVGTTVMCRYLRLPGLELAFAARVTSVFDDANRSGFTYRTLAGHPFAGDETFAVEKDAATGAVKVSIHSWSRPVHPLVRLLGPIARGLQVQGGRAAVARVADLARPL